MSEEAMRDQAEHGFNALTGGPGMRVLGIKNGRAEIDSTDADRWMALAVKHGLTMPGDSYQGMDVNFAFSRSSNKDCMATNEENARRHYGIGFGELIRIVYGAVEAHGREKGWPRRSYYLVDEPRPEFGNIESCQRLIELHVKSAPGTRFSGYSDHYSRLLPVSISHHTEASLRACREAGREAWKYGSKRRHELGRWLFVAREKGLSGTTVPYQYVNSCPYFDYSGNEGAWGVVFPSADGVTATVEWERVAEGIDDYRYLKTLSSLIDAARRRGRRPAEAAAAEKFLAETLNGITVDNRASADLRPDEWAAFRAGLVKHLGALSSVKRRR